ncbi:multifunctional CCA tRNA nucleotidyl transferase/2'3'-cyclic phosphodiesterase/2'nucleotidase/phosphatase [Marinobacter sp.]|uniref:multifunctional CCA tRNA nucleotidyl transferase/2'3'-cyclic phosphodiesterase/2'nucleotidase/phosphatase n=1 Tax=Marinobacter sp. TaxID=50741 RepID=UPI00384E5906
MEIYLVGGAVRDALLGREVKDRDWVVVGATPEEMLRRGYRQVGADFPVFIHPETGEEYALARTERKQGHGYHGFTVYSAPDVTLEDDLQRRDLTINAMARDTEGNLVDPFNGRRDLEAKTLRHVSEAFAEDPLRVLRTARFAARFAPLGFSVADETMALMKQMVADGELDHLVPERVWQEMQRALTERAPTVFFDVLNSCNALAGLIPELAETQQRRQAMAALHCTAERDEPPEARFAALLSPLLPQPAEERAQALKAPNEYQDLATLVTRHGEDLKAATSAADQLTLLETCDVWRRPERFEKLLSVCQCLEPPLDTGIAERLKQAEKVAREVSPRELMGEGYSGRALGEAIRDERLKRIRELNAREGNPKQTEKS